MTVALNDTIERYVISGAGPYAFSWRIFNDTDLQVYALSLAVPPVPTLLTLNTHYTVTGANVASGGSITLLTAAFTPYAGFTVDIRANTPENQPTSIRNQARFLPEIHEDAYDYLSRQIQDLRRLVDAKIGAPDYEPTLAMILPPVATRAGKYSAFDSLGQPIASSGTGNDSALRTDLATGTPGGAGAQLVAARRNSTGSVARTLQAKLDERITLLDFGGVGDGITNNDTAFTNANTAAIASGLFLIDVPAGDFLVSALPTLDARVRLTGEGRIVTTTTHRRTWEYGGMAVTTGARTIFVNPATGNDKNDGTSATVVSGNIGPIKTLQRAWNMIPPIVEHRITVQMADGNYEAQEFLTTDMERPSVLYCTGKYIRGRSDQSAGGADTTGYVLFKGTTKAGTVIRTFGAFIYGVYVSQVSNIAFDEMTLRSNVASTNSLLVSHRPGTYIQGSNIDIDGNAGQASFSCDAESGGVIELTGNGVHSGSVNGVQTFDGSVISLSDTITVSGTSTALSLSGGVIVLAGTVTISSLAYAQSGKILVRGNNSGSRCTFTGNVQLLNAVLDATFTNFSGTLDATNSWVYCNTCGYSNAWGGQNSDLYFQATPSFISPAVVSTVATPLSLGLNSRWRRDSAASSPINGSGGRTNAVRTVVSQSIASNGATVAVFLSGGDRVVHRIDGSGGNRINCLLAAVDTSFGGAPMEGTQLQLINTTANSVQIINSATTDIVGGGVLLGSAGAASNYKGITLVWENGAWREASRSLIVP